MHTYTKQWIYFWLAWAACLVIITALARGDVLRLTLDPALSATQQTQCRKVEALFNKLILDRGLDGSLNTIGAAVLVRPIDGRGRILAQTYAGAWRMNRNGVFVLDGSGRTELDSVDLPRWSEATLTQILFHEFSHLFSFQDVIWSVNGQMPDYGFYIGPALAVYRDEVDPFAQWIPVNQSHFAQSLSPWLMTPALTGSYVSRTWLAMLQDNGCTVRADFQGGWLVDLLPRRLLAGPITINTP